MQLVVAMVWGDAAHHTLWQDRCLVSMNWCSEGVPIQYSKHCRVQQWSTGNIVLLNGSGNLCSSTVGQPVWESFLNTGHIKCFNSTRARRECCSMCRLHNVTSDDERSRVLCIKRSSFVGCFCAHSSTWAFVLCLCLSRLWHSAIVWIAIGFRRCSDCSCGEHTCMACGEASASKGPIVKCGMGICGRFYHISCVMSARLTHVLQVLQNTLALVHLLQWNGANLQKIELIRHRLHWWIAWVEEHCSLQLRSLIMCFLVDTVESKDCCNVEQFIKQSCLNSCAGNFWHLVPVESRACGHQQKRHKETSVL